jgi:hypothetical protein
MFLHAVCAVSCTSCDDLKRAGMLTVAHVLQPISSFDWHSDKEGLCVMGSYDQSVRVAIVTKLNKV